MQPVDQIGVSPALRAMDALELLADFAKAWELPASKRIQVDGYTAISLDVICELPVTNWRMTRLAHTCVLQQSQSVLAPVRGSDI